MNIIFMGTPEFAVPSLQILIESGYNVVAVVTQPDKPVGRHGSVMQPSAVKTYAMQHGIPVLQPEKMKDETFLEQLRSFHADLQVVVAFRMLPQQVWDMPPLGTFNVHAALLPQYRGAAPINWAIINGEKQTGVTTFFLDHDIDTGRIIKQKTFDIPDDADVEFVYDGLMRLGAEICKETVDLIAERGTAVEALPQLEDGELRLAPKIFKETCEINWEQTAKHVYDFVRGLSPYPGTWTNLYNEDNSKQMVLKVFKTMKTDLPANGTPGTFFISRNRLYVNTSDCLLELLELQPAGKRRMSAQDFLNGMRDIEEYRASRKTD